MHFIGKLTALLTPSLTYLGGGGEGNAQDCVENMLTIKCNEK